MPPIPRPIQLEPNTLRPRRFVCIPREWSPRIDRKIQAESQRDWWGAHRAPLLGRPENRALGIKIRATPRPETRPGFSVCSGRPMFISPKQNPMSKAYLVRFVWPKPYFLPDLGPAAQCQRRPHTEIVCHSKDPSEGDCQFLCFWCGATCGSCGGVPAGTAVNVAQSNRTAQSAAAVMETAAAAAR